MDTKTLLILAAAGGAFWYLRSQQAAAANGGSTASNYNTGAANYQQQPVASSIPRPASGSWFDQATGLITGAAGTVQAGATAWGDIKGAFNSHPTASTSGGVWAGPITYTS